MTADELHAAARRLVDQRAAQGLPPTITAESWVRIAAAAVAAVPDDTGAAP